MSNGANNTKVQCFPIDLEQCSVQVQTLYPLDPGYQQRVHKLWDDTSDNPSCRELQRRGYAYLVSLFYAMPTRALADNKPMSSEFKDITFFMRYVGPRTMPTHSLHRPNNDVGYRIGNVEWASKRTQSGVRKGTQLHLYLGRNLTDRLLAEFLNSKGRKATAEAIKKTRQRHTRRGIAPNEITRLIFERHLIPYATSYDPVEAWDFPSQYHVPLTKLYPAFSGPNETRIHYFVRWLEEQIQKFTNIRGDFNTSEQQKIELSNRLWKFKEEKSRAQEALKKLHQRKIDKLLAESAPALAPPQKVIPLHKTPMTIMPLPNSQPLPKEPAAEAEAPSAIFLWHKALYSVLPKTNGPEELALAVQARIKELNAQGHYEPAPESGDQLDAA
jgi:hypothetical protein